MEALLVARDAWDSVYIVDSYRIIDDIQPDCEYVRRNGGKTHPRFARDRDEDWYEDDDGEQWHDERRSIAEQQRDYVQRSRAIDWLAWPPIGHEFRIRYAPGSDAIDTRVESWAKFTTSQWNGVFNVD